jgi:hypothetical protein
MAAFTVANPPGDDTITVGTSWVEVTVDPTLTAVYAQNLTAGTAVVTNIAGAGGPEFPLSTTGLQLVWAGARVNGTRTFNLKSDTVSSSVGLFGISDLGK